jgi:hypothetical protein
MLVSKEPRYLLSIPDYNQYQHKHNIFQNQNIFWSKTLLFMLPAISGILCHHIQLCSIEIGSWEPFGGRGSGLVWSCDPPILSFLHCWDARYKPTVTNYWLRWGLENCFFFFWSWSGLQTQSSWSQPPQVARITGLSHQHTVQKLFWKCLTHRFTLHLAAL